MSEVKKPKISALLKENPVVAVLRARHALEYAPVIEALAQGGVRSIELTLSTSGVMEQLPTLIDKFGSDVELGVGTITSAEEAIASLDRGAAYLVTPTVNHEVVAAACKRGVPVYPGGLTPTELLSGWKSGAPAVKLFPASTVGTRYLAQLKGPFPDLPIIPSGGIEMEDAPAWIAAGSVAVSIGGPLLQDAFKGGNLLELTKRARFITKSVHTATQERGAR
ncbi:2-dehydro-3-deoxyphosphogluconate aldolase [Arthrobacter sp. Soil782]|uniref:bifunctional 4-hydroxy-2-oxoglutarate aldolase/2-dehydro-3-deoxy-phosphogluconate aldolase n=1 Tax=Arthrobacter sp. Soil782 TaxID=1736410 RepID=UPI0007007392|nr:bifunctional 4-hydroxy-2-oxoglutarate aldolase/2-dehydro-3-deoxy-phosphogluconate aldolase [Arthrobacter sp. Soil782]KRF06343.1 2-dehydro-3-deoxyphosphogluconate aldolase [Arthrobacter sp. Soil782]